MNVTLSLTASGSHTELIGFSKETMAAAATVIDPTCVADIKALLESKKPVNQVVDQLVAVLQKHGLVHCQTGVTPSQVLCHPHNRAKQMISWLVTLAKGQQMLASGMKRQLLGESMAMELSIGAAKREQQINANKAIIQEAAGSMAPVSGQERFQAHLKAILFFPTKRQPFPLNLLFFPCATLCFPHNCIFESHPAWLHTRKWTSH